MMIECKCDICGEKTEEGMEKGEFHIFMGGYSVEMKNEEKCDLCLKCMIKSLQYEVER